MTRKQVLACLKVAGATDDRKTWMRLYVENRVSIAVANQQWREGRTWAEFIKYRDQRVSALLNENLVPVDLQHNCARDRLCGAQGD